MNADARTLPAAAQEATRNQAVRMWKRNIPRNEIAEQVGVHLLMVGKGLRSYQAGELKAVKWTPLSRQLFKENKLDSM